MKQKYHEQILTTANKLKATFFDKLEKRNQDIVNKFEEKADWGGFNIEGITKELGPSEDSINILDWAAMICSSQFQESYRFNFFASARSMERKLKIKKDPEKELEQYIQCAQFQVIPNKSLVTYLNSLAKAKHKGLPIEKVIVEWLEYSTDSKYDRRSMYMGLLNEKICTSFEKIAKAWKDEDFIQKIISSILHNYQKEALDDEFWTYFESEIAECISNDIALQQWATNFIPEFNYSDQLVLWLNILEKSSCLEFLKNKTNTDYTFSWLDNIQQLIKEESFKSTAAVNWLVKNIEHFTELFGDKTLKISGTTDLKAVSTFINAGVKLEPIDGEWRMHKASDWESSVEDKSIEALIKHPELKEALKNAIKMKVEFDEYDASWISQYGEEWAKLLGEKKQIESIFTLAEYFNRIETFSFQIDRFDQKPMEDFDKAIQHSGTADFLMNTLRLGLMDEWGWEALDKIQEELPKPIRENEIDGAFPYLCINADCIKKIIVIGPEGEICRLDKPGSFTESASAMRYVDGDVLYTNDKEKDFKKYWVSNPEKESKIGITTGKNRFTVKTPKGKVHEFDLGVIDKGAARIKAKHESRYFFSNGEKCWSCDYVYNKENKQVYVNNEFNPDTGKFLDEGSPLEWITSKIGDDDSMYRFCEYYPVPRTLTASPLGIKDGQYGLRLWREDKDFVMIEDNSGQSIKWKESRKDLDYALIPHGFLSLPERDKQSILLQEGYRLNIIDKESHACILPQNNRNKWWADEWLPIRWWHMFTPRDSEGSKALANCTKDQAQQLLNLALQTTGERTLRDLFEDDDFMIDQIQTVFPQITNKRLIKGIAGILKVAVRCEKDIAVIKARIKRVEKEAQEAEEKEDKKEPEIDPDKITDYDVEELGKYLKNRKRGTDYEYFFEQSMDSAYDFLNDENKEDGYYELTNSHINWPMLAKVAGSALFRALTSGESEDTKSEYTTGLWVWAESELLQNFSDYRIYEADITFDYNKVQFESRYFGFANGKSRYVICEYGSPNDKHLVIEKSVNGTFTDIPETNILWEVTEDTLSLKPQTITDTIDYIEENGYPEFNQEAVKAISKETAIDYATAALMWTNSIYSEKEDGTFMKTIKVKRAEEDTAKWELFQRFDEDKNILLDKAMNYFELKVLLSKLLPPNPITLYTPLKEDENGESAVGHFIKVWKEHVGLRRPLDSDLMQRLKKDFQDPNGLFFYDVKVLENPSAYNGLAVDEKWVMRPYEKFPSISDWDHGSVPGGEPKMAIQYSSSHRVGANVAFTGFDFKRFMKLLSWAHLEMPANFAQDKQLCKSAELIAERLKNPDLLMLAGAVNLVEKENKDVTDEFNELIKPFEAEPYKPTYGKLEEWGHFDFSYAEGYDRGDIVVTWPVEKKNGIFIAFRPAQINSGEKLDKIAHELGIYDVFKRGQSFCACGLNFGRNTTRDITSLPHFLLWNSEGFKKILDIYKQENHPTDKFYADPLFSVPELVKEVQEKLDISENSARLFLQIIALPDPNQVRVMRYNNWKKAVYQKAEDELKNKELVKVMNISRTKRLVFMSGGIDIPSPPAAPLESYKTALYGLEYDKKKRPDAPYGMILPQRPLNEIFKDAWKMYKNGDFR